MARQGSRRGAVAALPLLLGLVLLANPGGVRDETVGAVTTWYVNRIVDTVEVAPPTSP